MTFGPFVQNPRAEWLRYLSEHGGPVTPKPEYTPAVMRTDWKADTQHALHSAKVGALILGALALSVLGTIAWYFGT